MDFIFNLWILFFSDFPVWCRHPPKEFSIDFDIKTRKSLEAEINERAEEFVENTALKIKEERFFFEFLILAHIFESLEEKVRSSLFRPATFKELKAAKLPLTIREGENRLQYGFYETYGYRFTILFNFHEENGTIVNYARLVAMNRNVIAILVEAEEWRINSKAQNEFL